MEEDPKERSVTEFLLGFVYAFEFALGDSDGDD